MLVRRCGSIRRLESLGSWLYGVACRVAARARVDAARRRAAERRGALRVVQAVDPVGAGDQDRAEFGPVIQEEVRRLPEKYRAVVALCYWQGLTQEQAATQLGCPLGTVPQPPGPGTQSVASAVDPSRSGSACGIGGRGTRFPIGRGRSSRLGSKSADPFHSQSKCHKSWRDVRSTDVASTSVAVLTQSVLRSMFMMKFRDGRGRRWCSSVSELMERVWRRLRRIQRRRRPNLSGRRSYPTAEKSKSKAQPATCLV